MRKISTQEITKAVAALCIKANTDLRSDVQKALRISLTREKNRRARRIFAALLENADYARKFKLAICQDTGLPHVFVELGQQVLITGEGFLKAINRGIEQGYKKGCLRNSIVARPLRRNVEPAFSPGVVHIDTVKGRYIKLTVLPKGFGCENKSAVQMFNPTVEINKIKEFVIRKVREAGPDACPPFIIGLGIGGGLEQAAALAKQALLQPIDRNNPDRFLARLEGALLKEINQLDIGPLGLGGKTTCLGVNILTHPTHIAGLPVAVNISCHALRSATKRL